MVGRGPGRAGRRRARVRLPRSRPAPGAEQRLVAGLELAPLPLPVLPGQVHLGGGGGHMGMQRPGRARRRQAIAGRREESLLRDALAQLGTGHAQLGAHDVWGRRRKQDYI